MLSQLLIVRLKAAENALRDGRLDEAYRLATAPDIREHRRGAAILANLSKKFIDRARRHYRADRFTEALIDLDRAETGGVMKEEIAELREQVRTVARELERRNQSRRERLVEARRRVQDGSLIAGRKILDHASKHDEQAQELRGAIDARTDEVAAMVREAELLIKQGRLSAAARRIATARARDKHSEAVARIETRLCVQALENARAAIEAGRIRRAADELSCLGTLGQSLPARRDVQHMLTLVRDARSAFERHHYHEARQQMMSLARWLPKASWLSTVIDQLRQIVELETALGASPLGERSDAPVAQAVEAGPEPNPAPTPGARPVASHLDDTVALPARAGTTGALPTRLLLMVNGGGSYLLLRSPQASIGRAASRDPADVPLFSDVGRRHANITRVEEDYFIFSSKEIEIGGRKTRHQLLRDGDRIVLGPKAKLTFRMPSRKSTTAVLDLSDTTKMPHDVRRVVLFHRHALVGSGHAIHVGCQGLGIPLVLFEKDGALWLRQRNNGHVDTAPVKLILGQTVDMAGASLVVEPWPNRAIGPTGGA